MGPLRPFMWIRHSFVLLFLGFFIRAHADPLRVTITQGQVAPTPIAVTPFYSPIPSLALLGGQIADVISKDLERCGLFKIVDPRAFIQTLESLQKAPQFPEWRVINAQILTQGAIKQQPDGKIRVEFRLYDIVRETTLEAFAFIESQEQWRRMAHKIADAIYERVTGEKGYFDTKIVYVSEVGPHKKRVRRLALMDQDGANHRFLTSGQSIVLTPRFSPDWRMITYIDFQTGKPKVWVMDTHTQKKTLIGNFPGMTFAPRFSPDGKNMVMSFAKDGQTSLYSFDLTTRESKRLTTGPFIDTSPSYSPDGSQICFNSDRGGRTQIYVMNRDGSDVKRISFGQGSYRTPVWSPRGDMIAFTKITDGAFYIGVMKTDGSDERLLAQGWVVEDPCWAPGGRVLMFTRQESRGRSRIYTIDMTGHNERALETPTDGTGASWSPLIP